jgi:taurine transport system substrate-binding protein
MQKTWLAATLGAATLLGASLAQADDTVRIGYQTVIDPAKVAQADGIYDKAIGKKVDWRKFDSGADVIAAIAGGSIDIGLVGSSPLAVAASNRLPIQTFLIADEIGDAEALVVRNGSGIEKPEDLVGKTVAVPFVSTTHYSLLAALKHWGVDPAKVKIVNTRPPEIAAAWQRGDIDAAYVWDPALGAIKQTGKVLVSSAEVAKWGAPTFDAWIVRNEFAEKNPEAVAAFVKVTGDYYADYLKDPKAWVAAPGNVDKIAQLTGSRPEDVGTLLLGSRFPSLADQASAALLGGGTVKAIADASAFLKEQKKIEDVLADYTPYVNVDFVRQGAATN